MKLFSLLFLCAICAATPVFSQTLTLEELTDPSGMTTATLSPDGRHIAAILFDGINHGLILVNTETLAVTKSGQSKRVSKGYWSYDKAPRDVTWAGNDVLGIDYGFDAESMDLHGKKLRTLGEEILGRVDTGENAGMHIVMKDSANDHIARCDARTAQCTKFWRPPGKIVRRAFDRKGNLRAVTLLTSPFFKNASTVANWYKRADEDRWVKLAEFSITDEYWTPVYVPDEPGMLVIHSRIGRDTYALFNYDIAQGRQSELLAGHPSQYPVLARHR